MNPLRQKQLRQFTQKLGLSDQAPVSWGLLDRALTDPTAHPHDHYERLEFVGDAVAKLATASFLFERYPDLDEGVLSSIRSILVSDRTLAAIAGQYGLERYLLVGSSAMGDRVGLQTRLAAAFEAVLAALFLSTQDLSLVRPWLDRHLDDLSREICKDPTLQNPKGALQGLTQAHYRQLPDYRVKELSQSYGDAERFIAEVWLDGRCLGQGKGKSKKAAEQTAAQAAFLTLQELHPHQSAQPHSP
jgi:ribonuclease III